MTGSMSREGYRPVIVLGAARSGTRIVRDAIAAHPAIVAVPHDINFVWKYGNYHICHDGLTPKEVTPQSAAFIYNFFQRFHEGRPGGIRVVEKTVSNTIRVAFVRKIFPSCQFIHLIRDGRDVVASSVKQWQAPLDSVRVLEKIRYLPLSSIPEYAGKYVLSYLKRKFSRTKRVSSWGVALEDLDCLLQQYSLIEVCAIQWKKSVESASAALQVVPESDKLEVRYEHFVKHPIDEMNRIINFLGLEVSDEVNFQVKEMVNANQEGKWIRQIKDEDLNKIMAHISSTMHRLGYLNNHEPNMAI